MAAESTPLSTSSGNELTVTKLESELWSIAANWEMLGRKLGLDEGRLKIIAADFPTGDGASMKRLAAALDQWCKNCTEGSWNHIIRALREMKENALAEEIKKKYCSTAEGLSQTQSYEIQQEQREEVVALVRTNQLMMKDRFAQLQTVIYEKIQERLDAKEIKIKNFRVYMTNLFPPGECIPNTADVSEIFTAITNNSLWDYYNCEPLERVAKMYGGKDPTLMENLEAYTQDLVGYKLVTKMADYLSTTSSSGSAESPTPVRKDQEFRKKLTIKLNIPIKEQSLMYVDEIWNSLSRLFCLPSSSAILDKIIEGSLYITWLIPALFVPQVMEIAEQPEAIKFFQETRIQMIEVDGACLYEEQEDEEGSSRSDSSSDKDHGSSPKLQELATSSNSCLTLTIDEESSAAAKSIDDDPLPHINPHSEPYSPLSSPQPQITPGYDVELVKDSPDLHCPICLLVQRNPMQVNCCGKRFCQVCIDTIIENAKPCPACNSKAGDYSVFHDKGQKQAIAKARVNCSNKKVGCGWAGELEKLDNHLNLDHKGGQKMDEGCQYVKLKCNHCSKDCQRHHIRSCSKKLYTCPYCKHYSSTYKNISSHHLSLCEEFPVQCKMCSMKIPQKSLQHHHLECKSNKCPSNQSTATPLKNTTAMTTSVFLQPPSFIMADFTNYYKKHGVSWYSPPFYSHIGGYKMRLNVHANGQGDFIGRHVSICVCVVHGEYDNKLTWPLRGDIRFQLVNQRRNEGHIEITATFDSYTLNKHTGRVIEGKRVEGSGSFKFIPHSALHCDEFWNTEYLKNDCLEFQILQVKLSKTTIERLLPMIHKHQCSDTAEIEHLILPSIPPVHFIMSNFISLKMFEESWYSPPFYSHIGGYKICLRVYPNGYSYGTNSYVSVYVCLMQGEHDENLPWPFRGDITVQLVNQRRNERHMELTVTFNDRTPDEFTNRITRLTEREGTLGWGSVKFISYKALHCDESRNTEYLKGDCLEFRITKVNCKAVEEMPAKTHDQQRRETELHQVSIGLTQTLFCEAKPDLKWYEESVTFINTKTLIMKGLFIKLQRIVHQKIQKRLTANEIKIKNFMVYITTLFSTRKCIPKTTDVSKIFTAITTNHLWDYLNYQPLQRVADMYGGNDEHLKAKFEEYIEELNRYKAVTKIAEYLSTVPIMGDKSSPTLARNGKHCCSELTVKLQISVTTQSLSYIDKVWISLSRKFLLPPSPATLSKITEGSLYITWLIPVFFVPEIMEGAEQPEVIRLFHDMKVEIATVDGACFYEKQKEQENFSDGLFYGDQEQLFLEPAGLATSVDSIQKKLVPNQHHDTARSMIDIAEAAAVKLVDGKPSLHTHLYPELHPHPHSSQPQVTGYNVNLVKESLAHNLLCPICHFVLHNPMQISCCGTRFCRSCIIIAGTNPCPSCKSNAGDSNIFQDIGHQQAILEAKVLCPNSKMGCSWIGELCQLDKHLNLDPDEGKIDEGCQYVKLKCIHCSADCQRHHMQGCLQQPYTCPYCKHYTSNYVNSQHLSVCDEFPFQCRVCSKKVLQKSLQHHHIFHQVYEGIAIPHEKYIIKAPDPSKMFVCPSKFIMANFTYHKESGEPWWGSPFYSHIGGYTMCLKVRANGDGDGTGTHVSVFVCLMCGEYDDNLTWPFIGSVTFQLVNQSGTVRHKEYTAYFGSHTPGKYKNRVTEGEIGQGWGSNEFIPHSDLHYDESRNTQYLKNDCLEFRITQVKLTFTMNDLISLIMSL